MPTDRPRHTVTETEEIARALDAAAERWPDDREARGRLLVQLVREGHRRIADSQGSEVDRRREAIRITSGALTGAYPDNYLQSLRGDWPA